ncbi:hypothetical protein [Streptomyces sp. 6N223]|uniref:hypothetical protein n=1 Tax=Streptomyces sp. 6N223 TaxID=3457412 RepID=UPI003FD1BA2F
MAARTGSDPLQTFRSACHEAARRTPDVTFYELTEACGAPEAFHSAAMSDRRLRHRIVCHPATGHVAFAAPPAYPGSAELRFREPPAWAEVFGWFGLRVLRPEVLATPLASVDVSGLGREERERLRRDRSRTLGELLFSWRTERAARGARPG